MKTFLIHVIVSKGFGSLTYCIEIAETFNFYTASSDGNYLRTFVTGQRNSMMHRSMLYVRFVIDLTDSKLL